MPDYHARQPAAGRSLRSIQWVAGLTLTVLMAGCQDQRATERDAAPAEPLPLTDDAAKASYSIGYLFADNVAQQFGDEIEIEAFIGGVRDVLAGADARIDEVEAQRVLNAMVERRQVAAVAAASSNLDAGLRFLAENAERDGVITLDSGLQYEVLEAGEGTKPGATDIVTTHYEGRLIDGTVFDSSYARGEPATFPLDRVIPGWTEGLQQMAPGGKHRLFVPSELAYGDRPAGDIPPNSALIFDVELLSVESGQAGSNDVDPGA
jgi:FKBP-type peptidyl-prolyl cis-trans isomerase